MTRTRFERYDYLIAGHFLPALLNGDESGMTDADRAALAEFADTLPAGSGHWSVDADDRGAAARCEICQLHAHVYVAQYFVAVEAADYRVTTIGHIDHDAGTDQYILIRDMEDDIDLDAAHDWLRRAYFVDSTGGPGSYFCNSFRVIPDPIHGDRCIGIVNHRRDV